MSNSFTIAPPPSIPIEKPTNQICGRSKTVLERKRTVSRSGKLSTKTTSMRRMEQGAKRSEGGRITVSEKREDFGGDEMSHSFLPFW
jgi:hypothetical protein